MERNHVYACNFAVSVGSENAGKLVSNVIVRNNVLHHCHVGGIVIGGSGVGNGGADNCAFTNNTLYDNDTVGFGGGQVMIQNHVTNTSIQRNLMASTASFVQFVLKDNSTGSFAADAIDWNLYKRNSGASLEFIWNGTAYSSFANWKSAGGIAKDTNSTSITGSLGLVNSAPVSASPATDFALTATSPAKDAGDSIALPFTPAAGEKDFFGQSRVANARVDIGADEFMTSWQAWRDLYFALPDGGPGAGALDDSERDGATNLIEYSQGMNPTLADAALLPFATVSGANWRFNYRKAAAELIYTVEQSTTLSGPWLTLSVVEQTDGAALFWRDTPLADAPRFLRLRVTQP
jgi:hypothetical protein